MKEIIKNLKTLKKNDYILIFVFFIFFLLSVSDMNIMNFFINKLFFLKKWNFFIAYGISIYVLFETTRLILNNFNKKSIESLLNFKKIILLISTAYYVGLLINLSNAFVFVLFNKYIGG